MKRKAPVHPGLALLRARISKGGDLDPQTLSRSFGVPVRDVEKMLHQNGRVS